MFDVCIIGAGVIGSFVAKELSKYNIDICVLEKHVDVAMAASGANSGIVHGGYDAKVNSLKAKFNIAGCKIMEEQCRLLQVPYKKCGSLVIAFNDEEFSKLDELYNNGIVGGVEGLSIINKKELHDIEPNISEEAIGALLCKSAGVVSPYKLAIAAMELAVINGVKLFTNEKVVDIKKENDIYTVYSDNKEISSKVVINCAGIYSDKIANMVGDESFSITPRKGEYLLFDRTEGELVNRVVFQVATEKGKGVLVTPSVDGNLIVGPDANVIGADEEHATHKKNLDAIYETALKSCKKVNLSKTITVFCGVRATPSTGDFVIGESSFSKGFINVAGIESPGITSAPEIGAYVEKIAVGCLDDIKVKKEYKKRLNHIDFSNMNIKEKNQVIKEHPLYGQVICRCEGITKGEIVDSINRPVGATTVDGVKRRTRSGMGRCQGGFCMPLIVDILEKELSIKKEEVQKADEGSYILTKRSRA